MPQESPEFESRVHELLDSRQAPEDDAWVQSQIALSSENKQLLAGQQLMLDGLEMSEVPELPANFAEQCVAGAMELEDTRPTASKDLSRESYWRIPAAIAGVALLLAVAVPFWGWMTSDSDPAPIATNPPAEIQPEAEEVPPTPENPIVAVDEIDRPTIDDEPSDSSPPIDSVAESEDQQYEDLYEMFRDLRERIPPTDGDENLLALRPQWVDDMATGLRPVADSVGGALNAIRRNLPPSPKVDGDGKPQAWMHQSRSSQVS